MDMDEYQKRAERTALYRQKCKDDDERITYCLMGLGEAGEVQGKWKKYLRGDKRIAQTKAEMLEELGDLLWYVAMLADEIGVPLSLVANHNLNKLADRAGRGVVQGDGDKR